MMTVTNNTTFVLILHLIHHIFTKSCSFANALYNVKGLWVYKFADSMDVLRQNGNNIPACACYCSVQGNQRTLCTVYRFITDLESLGI